MHNVCTEWSKSPGNQRPELLEPIFGFGMLDPVLLFSVDFPVESKIRLINRYQIWQSMSNPYLFRNPATYYQHPVLSLFDKLAVFAPF